MAMMAAKWQDWTSFALGLWLAVSPWAAGYAAHESATANAVFIGLALALGAQFEAACDQLQAEWLNVAAGIWLVFAPFLLGFTDLAVASANSLAVGICIAALAASALSLDKEVARAWHFLRYPARHVHGHRASGGPDRRHAAAAGGVSDAGSGAYADRRLALRAGRMPHGNRDHR
jgi:hypothetical protein